MGVEGGFEDGVIVGVGLVGGSFEYWVLFGLGRIA